MGTRFYIGPIKLVGWFTSNKYILVATNYATKRVEVKDSKPTLSLSQQSLCMSIF